MQISTMSVVVGSAACNARCPFCVSKMTPANGVTIKADQIDYGNWHAACRLAQVAGVTTVLITGKGEPTLFPAQVTEVLTKLKPYDFPIIEMQTNGIPLTKDTIARSDNRMPEVLLPTEEVLRRWYDLGLRTIAISNVGYNPAKNHEIYLPYKDEYIDLAALIARLHKIGFGVRLATVLIKGGVDSPEAVDKLLEYAREHKVEQLKLCPVTKPGEAHNEEGNVALGWIKENYVTPEQLLKITQWVQSNGHFVRDLGHNAKVYDVRGQNICLSNCLTVDPDPNAMRQIIYFPDGRVRDSWEFSGAVIL
jgi:molybdenum cofactor biosynthesis enzyme MoaA